MHSRDCTRQKVIIKFRFICAFTKIEVSLFKGKFCKADKIINLISFFQKLKNLILPTHFPKSQLLYRILKTETQRKPKSLKFTANYNSLNELERNEFRYFVLMSNVKGRNYESILKLITTNNFILKDRESDYKDRTLWNRISELTILMEKYLAMKELLNEPAIVKLFAIKQLRKRNLKDLFISGLNKYINDLNNAPLRKRYS